MTLGPFWVSFLLKILVTAAVVIAAARTAERAGPFFGALIACLPVSAGPSYVLLSLQASDGFIAETALASAAVSAGAALFLAVYVVLGPRAGVAATLGTALGAWLVAAILIRQFQWTAPAVAALNAVAYGLAFLVIPRLEHSQPISRSERRWFDLPVMAAMVGLLVAGVVSLSAALGPALTGIAAVIPVTFSSLGVIVHSRLGGRVAAATMAGAIRAMPGFVLGLLVLNLLAVPAGAPLAMLAALAAMLAWSGGLILWRVQRLRASRRR
jgi:hypothetical protein